jgi:hypothetical protein
MDNLWQKYKVIWTFKNRLCGSFPENKDMISPWLEARKPANKPEGGRDMAEIEAEAIKSIEQENEEKVERTTLGFQRNDDFLVMRGGTIKAHIKDCARVLSSFGEKPQKGSGLRSLAVRATNCIYPEDYWVPILKEDKQGVWRKIKVVDGEFDKAVHVQTAQGPRNALKRIKYVENPTLEFHLAILSTPKGEVVSQAELEQIFEYGAIHGYAGERGDGEGRYEYEVVPVAHSAKKVKAKA